MLSWKPCGHQVDVGRGSSILEGREWAGVQGTVDTNILRWRLEWESENHTRKDGWFQAFIAAREGSESLDGSTHQAEVRRAPAWPYTLKRPTLVSPGHALIWWAGSLWGQEGMPTYNQGPSFKILFWVSEIQLRWPQTCLQDIYRHFSWSIFLRVVHSTCVCTPGPKVFVLIEFGHIYTKCPHASV